MTPSSGALEGSVTIPSTGSLLPLTTVADLGDLDVAVGRQPDGQPVQLERAALVIDNSAVPTAEVPPENGIVNEAPDDSHVRTGERLSLYHQRYLLQNPHDAERLSACPLSALGRH